MTNSLNHSNNSLAINVTNNKVNSRLTAVNGVQPLINVGPTKIQNVNTNNQRYCGTTLNEPGHTYRDSVPELGGNFQRLKYDAGNYARHVEQSTRPLDFILDPVNTHRCNPCRPEEVGYLGKFGVSYDTNQPLIDTESELLNLTRPASNDPNFKYLPFCPNCGAKKNNCGSTACLEGLPCGDGVSNDCVNCQPKLFHFPSCGLRREFSRISNPTYTLKETGVNRFQPTYLDHQDPTHWELQGEVGINYCLVAKDNHVPCIPRPIDQTPALPVGKPIPCQPIVAACANPIGPLHNHYRRTDC